jgi:hypothetical protein
MLGGRTYSIATNEILPEFDLGLELFMDASLRDWRRKTLTR